MEEELNENELEERFYSMLHYVDDTQPNNTTNQNALDIIENAPRSTLRRYWRTSSDTTTPLNTPFQKVNIPKEAPKPATEDTKPKSEKCSSPSEPLPQHLSLFQTAVPQNLKKTVEIVENEDNNVVELESSDEDEVIEVALPPKPTITIESSDEDDISIQDTPTKVKNKAQEKSSSNGEREVSASPVPSIVSSVSDEFIRGDCIAFNISSHRPDNHSFDFSLHGSDILGSTPSKKKKRKKNKNSTTSTPIVAGTPQNKSTVEECFATPKSKAKNKKQKTKSYAVTEKSVPSADVYDSDSNQSIISVAESNKNLNSCVVIEKSLPCVGVHETDSNPSETPRVTDKSKTTQKNNIESSDSSIDLVKPQEETNKTTWKDTTLNNDTVTIDLTDNTFVDKDIQENIVIGNVTGFTESEDYEDEPVGAKDAPKFGSTKVPAILYENLDFDNLKGKDKVCKNRRYSLTTLRAEMEKFYNESWGGENFNHREIQKNMSRDKSLWAIDPKDRMPSLNRKKYNVTCNYCNRPGHRDDTCRLKPPVCFMCGNTGHMEPRCPSKICVNCGSPNHMYSTMCRNCVNWGRITCAECGQNGHPSSHCPDVWRRYHNTIDLTQVLEENRYTKKHHQLFCSGCTRRGHLVHTCRLSLPFSGLPINSPYVNMYRPIYTPVSDTNVPHQNNYNQKNKQPFKSFQQDSTISSATLTPTRTERAKRQSKSPTAHETHSNKKRNMSMSEITEVQVPKSPVRPDHQRKTSQSKEPSENIEEVSKEQDSTTNVPETEAALDFIPIFSSNHDKKGQVIQDNEVSDTSEVVTSARIYVTNDIIDKLKSTEGEDWLKLISEKCHVSVENTETNSFLSIKGKVGDQEAFQSALRDWTNKEKSSIENSHAHNDGDVSQQSEGNRSLLSNNIPKNRNNVLRKLNKAFESLKEDLGEPNELFKELNYLQNRHEQLLKQKVINPKQLDNNRDRIKEMLKKLNMVLIGQSGLADGSKHLKELHTLHEKLINFRQKNIPLGLRKEIGEHFHTIFTAIPRYDYGELLESYNFKQTFKKKKKIFSMDPKVKKFNTIPFLKQKKNRNPVKEVKVSVEKSKPEILSSKSSEVRKPLVEKTKNKLVFYKNRLMNAHPHDTVHKKTRLELMRKLQSYIASLSRDEKMSSKSIKKMRRVQEQAQLFLNNV